MTTPADILNETAANNLSVRGNCWRTNGIALAGQASQAFWIADRERKAVRRGDASLVPWANTPARWRGL
jgi:hypothetical protein